MPVLSTDTARLNGMPKPSAATTPFHLVYGGDSYLNDQTVRDLKHEAQRRYPDAETIELDAANADHYAFDEAVSPSLLADRAIVHQPAERGRKTGRRHGLLLQTGVQGAGGRVHRHLPA